MKDFKNRSFFEKILYVGNKNDRRKLLVVFGVSIRVKRHLHLLRRSLKYHKICRLYFGTWLSCLRIAKNLPLKVGVLYHIAVFLRNRIVMHYFACGPNGRNAGDMFNHELARFFLGKEACSLLSESNMLAIGSILDQSILSKKTGCVGNRAKKNLYKIWGSGFIRPLPDNARLNCDIDVHAVRGYNTLSQLRELTGELFENCVVGDPGLLASYLLPYHQYDDINTMLELFLIVETKDMKISSKSQCQICV